MKSAPSPRAAPLFWRQRGGFAAALLPVSALFRVAAALRRRLYLNGILRRERLPVPVIVVGNISVGGSGKTPVAAWLAEELRKAGRHPGIVSRGYGGDAAVSGQPCLVGVDADPAFYGDEPVLLARLTGCPVVTARDRPAAARTLLAAHPECDVLISDDGMQHYRLARTVEVAVLDEAALGNCWPLPSGPLREPLARLADVDLILAHGGLSPRLRTLADAVPVVPMRLEGDRFRSLSNPDQWRDAAAFAGQRVHALAGIGQPQRFFDQLAAMGIQAIPHPFPDHYRYRAADLAFAPGEPKLMTSKDAVKCAALKLPDAWELPVRAIIAAEALGIILEKLDDGRQTARNPRLPVVQESAGLPEG
ncbi:MAG: tetraacyldisaccharide 4'-kinase [Azoarcus sp.]|jgi:tetraacyldisaccharide 4'-kinase|nr:tetraacyldisaccharide 4'-kinase [Azoarcus sp.]